MKVEKAIKKLEEMKGISDLQDEVIDELISKMGDYGSAENLFDDLLSYGCVSGMIGSLIYYVDTYKFFDTHYDDIMEVCSDYELETGVKFHYSNDLKNDYTWFAFERVAYKLYLELGIN